MSVVCRPTCWPMCWPTRWWDRILKFYQQIFNLRSIIEKYQEHQEELYHVFIDFKKAFDRVWHQALWATMNKYNINKTLISLIEELYNQATSSVYLEGEIGEWFHTTVGGLSRLPTIPSTLQYLSRTNHDRCS